MPCGSSCRHDILAAVTASARTVLLAATAAQVSVSFLVFGLPSISPALREDYDLSLAALGAVLTANLFGSGLALIAAGVAVDRFGSRAATVTGVALGVAGLLVAAASDSGPQLFVGLLVSGIGVAVVPVAGAGALFRVYRPERRGFALGIRQMAVPLGGVVGASALPALEDAGGVRLTLVVGAALLAVVGLAFAAVLGHDAPAASARPGLALGRVVRAPGMLRLFAVAAFYIVVLQALLTYAVETSRAAGLSAVAANVAFIALNVTAAVARLVWGRVADRQGGSRRVRTLVDIGALTAFGAVAFTAARHGGTGAVVAATIVFAFGAFGWNAIVYTTAGERLPPELAGQSVSVALTVVFVLSAVCTPPLGLIADHIGWDAFWLVCAALAATGAAVAVRIPRVG
jgi:MFS family permease